MPVSVPPPRERVRPTEASTLEADAAIPAPITSTAPLPQAIADRYLVEEELGRGGLAIVYRVLDKVRGHELALKQLTVPRSHEGFAEQSASFEREFHTLGQLRHPRIVEVFDFGVDPTGQYYTMELLDGGDVREQAPIPWRVACALMYDVCSTLALLHSRGLVHRDISPRNIRITHDGQAKVIDFGALSPMGATLSVIGTPPFVAPEILHRSTLDGRADLFSLGATFYFAITGHLAYSARHLSALQSAWQVRPAPPSAIVPDVPPALDALLLALISLDPAARPRSAFEVMQRLCSIAHLSPAEGLDVSQAYLATPVVIGRDDALAALRERIGQAVAGRGGSVLLEAAAGLGRSRLLDVGALEAKIAGALTLRANLGSSQEEVPLAVGRALAEQILDLAPDRALAVAYAEKLEHALFELREPPPPLESMDGPLLFASEPRSGVNLRPQLKQPGLGARERAVYQAALSRWLPAFARQQPLVVLVDDVSHADQASLSLLASLSLSTPKLPLLLVMAIDADAVSEGDEALSVLRRECARIELAPLTRAQSEALVISLFGDVRNAALLAERVHGVAGGSPRETLDVLQSLIERGTIVYRDGQWQLPGELSPSELPSSAADACFRALASLSPLARVLAEVHALSSHAALSRKDYGLAAGEVPTAELDAALSELVTARLLSGDGRLYSFARAEFRDALRESLSDADRRDRHRRLASVYADDERQRLEHADHLLLAGEQSEGLDALLHVLHTAANDRQGLLALTSMKALQVAALLERGLCSAEALARRPSEVSELQRALISVAVGSDERYYLRAAPAWLAQLEQDSGLSVYRSLPASMPADERLTRALTEAATRYQNTPESDRVSNPELAIRGLAYYVTVSIAIGSRMQDAALIASLPDILAPFAHLSPVLHALWQNAIATRETICDNRPEHAHTRWIDVLTALDALSPEELSYVAAVRGAIIYGIGSIEARMGLPSLEKTARLLDADPMQAVSAMSLRSIARLHKGDYAGSERFRKQAEQLALQANVRSMFSSTLQSELVAYALASDLSGIEQVGRSIGALAQRFPGWAGYKHLADGYYEQARDRLDAALAAFDLGLADMPTDDPEAPLCSAWPRLMGAAIETLVELGRAEEARARGQQALAVCEQRGIRTAAVVLERAVALSEAKLGDYADACQRLERVLAGMRESGVTGLELGATYEARARIAIWCEDEEAVVEYGALTAKEYRYGEGSSLGARYERLMDEARRTGEAALPQLVDFKTKMMTSYTRVAASTAVVTERLAHAGDPSARAQAALQLLCEVRAARVGHLYLRTQAGVRWAASLGTDQPDQVLTALAVRLLDELSDSFGDATATVTNHGDAIPSLPESCSDDAGIRYTPTLLVGETDAGTACAGLALIATTHKVPADGLLGQFTSAIATQLLEAGDVA